MRHAKYVGVLFVMQPINKRKRCQNYRIHQFFSHFVLIFTFLNEYCHIDKYISQETMKNGYFVSI